MKIEYKHQNSEDYPRVTIAIEIISKYNLHLMVEEGYKVANFATGVTFVHPNDNYIKTIGRNKALEKMSTKANKLLYIDIREDRRIVFHFTTSVGASILNGEKLLQFGISMHPDFPTSRLEYAYVQ